MLALKTNRLTTRVALKISSQAEDRVSLELPRSLIPRKLSSFDLPGCSLRTPIFRACIYLTILRACSVQTAFSLWHLLEVISGSCLTSQLSEVRLSVGTKTTDQKPWKEKQGNETSMKNCEMLQYNSRGSKRPHACVSLYVCQEKAWEDYFTSSCSWDTTQARS